MNDLLKDIASGRSPVRVQWLAPEIAVREVIAFERRFGPKHLMLACHAALPLFVTPELLNLIHINFLDSENIPWIAEADFLLSPLCHPVGDDVFEVEPGIREVLLIDLENRTNWQRPIELADFLYVYLEKKRKWRQPTNIARTQGWIAQAYLDPDKVIEEMTEMLNKSLSSEKPLTLNLPTHIQIATALEIVADPLEQTNSRDGYQYLINNARVLAQIHYGEEQAIRQKVQDSEIAESGATHLSPTILKWLTKDGKASISKSKGESKVKSVDMPKGEALVVILTAIPVEYQAVRAYLTKLRQEMHPSGTIYERGDFITNDQSWDVLIVETGTGNANAAVETVRAIEYFKPSLVLFVGVAGGLKDVKLGDVVVATKVYGYESGKASRTFQIRPDVGKSTYRMEQRARAEARGSDWLQRLQGPIPDPPPRVFVEPIAAGARVVASTRSAIWKFLKANYSDAVAVEMEGHGFLQAVHANQQVDALIIRGISDLIDGKTDADTKNYQEIAARHASAFAFEILAKLDVIERRQSANATGASSTQEQRQEVKPDTPNARVLREYQVRLEKMRTLFLFEKSAREITTMNISSWERELRDMIGGIDRLRGVPGIKKLLSSPDAVQAKLQRVIICLNLASDLLEKQITPRRREMLYQRYEEIPPLLSETMDLLTPTETMDLLTPKRKAN